ncbi:uncharacterized protein LOC114353360 [Ostrinia furnacalis]|uniref:uncharacterized protein LOC114353360 n=1 Tax=Ostrinia furnacalis TaxID=93504 RepID=UPI001038BF20|nr:uncharacterized protein LOC114353360 [Ostrinia furnacalis]
MPTIRRFCCDDETGEIMTYMVNDETGEPFVENDSPVHSGSRRIQQRAETVKNAKFPKGYITKTKKFQSLKERIIAGSNIFSHRLLLLPTLTVFPAYVCTFIVMLEVYLHLCCHKHNKHLKDPNLYYRSPFHMITSTFCGVCRDCDTASRIGQLQDQRRSRYDYFRSIAI